MKLKHNIRKSIRNYPLLYKAENYKKSEIAVLEHLFLVIGNGYEWFDGYLTKDYESPLPYGKQTARPLKKGFFKSKIYSYRRMSKSVYEIFLKNKIAKLKVDYVKRGKYYYWKYSRDIIGYKFCPYPICKYSGFVSMPDNVRLDWLKGAIKIVKLTLDYYNDETKFKKYFDYPHKKRIDKLSYDFKKLTDEGRFEEVAVKLWGAKLEDEHNPEAYAKRFWKKHKQKQIDYCEKFLQEKD